MKCEYSTEQAMALRVSLVKSWGLLQCENDCATGKNICFSSNYFYNKGVYLHLISH